MEKSQQLIFVVLSLIFVEMFDILYIHRCKGDKVSDEEGSSKQVSFATAVGDNSKAPLSIAIYPKVEEGTTPFPEFFHLP